MPLALDPAVIALLPDPHKRTNFLIEIDTPTPRRWTPFPGGLVIGAISYTSLDVAVSGVIESLEQTQPTAASITIANATGAVTDLAYNNANRRAAVRISRVWFDASWRFAGTDLWFDGETGKATLRGSFLTISCARRAGRTGSSPFNAYSEALKTHQIPDGQKTRWSA